MVASSSYSPESFFQQATRERQSIKAAIASAKIFTDLFITVPPYKI
jgi:hypothetical protein